LHPPVDVERTEADYREPAIDEIVGKNAGRDSSVGTSLTRGVVTFL
jgi:hypothetical protein